VKDFGMKSLGIALRELSSLNSFRLYLS